MASAPLRWGFLYKIYIPLGVHLPHRQRMFESIFGFLKVVVIFMLTTIMVCFASYSAEHYLGRGAGPSHAGAPL